MKRTGMQNRRQELLETAYENLKKLNQNQAKLIQKKDKEIKTLVKENTSLSYKLRVVKNKYDRILKEALKLEGEENEQN